MATIARITQSALNALKPNGKNQWLWEQTARGSLGIKMTPSGGLFAAFQYGSPPNQKRESLGQLSESFTIHDARRQAQKMGDALRLGTDATAAGAQARGDRFTVADLAARYLDSNAFRKKAEKTQGVDRGRINGHILPLIGHVPCSQLTPDQAAQFLDDVTSGKTACHAPIKRRRGRLAKGGQGVARKSVLLLQSMWAWGQREKLLTTECPAVGFELGRDERREISWTPDEYLAILAAVTYLEIERDIKPNQANAVRVLLYTGARSGEIAKARWEHYSPELGQIRLAATEHKTGKKTKAERIISLSAEAVAIISKMTPQPGKYIFGSAEGFPVNLKKAVPKIRARPGVPADFILHGLRHSLASALARSGASAFDIMFQLGHRKVQTSQNYIDAKSEQRAAIANRASMAMFEPVDKAPPALYVVPTAK